MTEQTDLATIEFNVTDHVATVALNRPERLNSFTQRMAAELGTVWARVRDDDDIRVGRTLWVKALRSPRPKKINVSVCLRGFTAYPSAVYLLSLLRSLVFRGFGNTASSRKLVGLRSLAN